MTQWKKKFEFDPDTSKGEKDEFDFSNPEEDRIEFEKRINEEKRKAIFEPYEAQWREQRKYVFAFLISFATLFIAFLPWSIPISILIFGLDETIEICKAILGSIILLIYCLILFVGLAIATIAIIRYVF